MSKELFWLCYLLFMAAILLLPLWCNIYSFLRYKMSFAKHDKQIIEAFCENATCVYVSKLRIFLYIATAIFMIICIFLMYNILFIGRKDGILLFIATFIVHILMIPTYTNCLYEKYVITNTAILIRYLKTKYIFVIVQLNDIIQYVTFSHPPFWFIDGNKGLTIFTKDNRKFTLVDLKNRDEFVAALRMFTDSVEVEEK